MTWIIGALCFVPTIWELYNDRNGENKKDKIKDTAIFLVVVGLIAGLSYWLGQSPVSAILLILGIRVMFFDYAIHYLLIKNKVIVGHWFTYNGNTSFIDRLISGVHPVLRFAARVIVFLASIFLFFA